jgi:hypothetical protein
MGESGNVEQSQTLRVIRNRLIHDGPIDDALKAAYLNDANHGVPLLGAYSDRVAPVTP